MRIPLRTPREAPVTADDLWLMAQTTSVSLVPSLKRSPRLRSLLPDGDASDLDLLLAVAALVTAGFKLAPEVDAGSWTRVMNRARQRTAEKHGQVGPAAFDDLQAFVFRWGEDGFEVDHSIGVWIMWNLRGADPTPDETQMAAMLGGVVVRAVAEWW